MDTATNVDHADTVEDDDALDAVEATGDRQPWTLPDDDPTPEPALSAGGWDGPLPGVDEPEGQQPIGMIVGGVGLGAVIAGLGVFSAFGLAGVAVAAGVAAVAAPVVAVAGADLRRRVQTGRWRPNAAGTAGRIRNGVAAARSAGAAGSRRAGGKTSSSRAGGSAAAGRSRRSPTAGARSAGLSRAGGSKTGGKPFGGKTAGQGGAAKRGLAALMSPAGGRHRAAGKPTASGAGRRAPGGSSVLGRIGKKANLRKKPTGGHGKTTKNAAKSGGVGQWGAWRAQRRDRAEAQRRARIDAAKQRRTDRWAKADARNEARRQRWTNRRANARKATARSARKAASWMRYPFTALWRRIVRARQRSRDIQWTAALITILAKIWQGIRATAARMPAWFGAPQTTPPKPHEDVIDGEIVDEPRDEAPPVARPGRRPYVMHPPAQLGPAFHAPAVPTPRSTTNSSRGARMDPAHEAVVDAFREAIGGWHPPDEGAFEDYESFFSSWEEMLNEMGDIVQGLSERFRDETPVETAVDYLSDLAGGFGLMAQAGGEVYNAWRTGNAADIERHENPRPNEQQLNVL